MAFACYVDFKIRDKDNTATAACVFTLKLIAKLLVLRICIKVETQNSEIMALYESGGSCKNNLGAYVAECGHVVPVS